MRMQQPFIVDTKHRSCLSDSRDRLSPTYVMAAEAATHDKSQRESLRGLDSVAAERKTRTKSLVEA
jgi:hypothetical protein